MFLKNDNIGSFVSSGLLISIAIAIIVGAFIVLTIKKKTNRLWKILAAIIITILVFCVAMWAFFNLLKQG